MSLHFIFLISLTFHSPAHAQSSIGVPMSPIEIYARCYARLTGEPLPLNDPARVQVTNGTVTPVDACMNIYDQAMWESSSQSLSNADTKPVALKVIRTLHNFHRSTFASRSYGAVDSIVAESATSLIVDNEEPALYLTRAALEKNLEYRSVVTTNHGLTGLRLRPQRGTVSEFEAQTLLRPTAVMPYFTSKDFPIAYRDLNVPGTQPEINRYASLYVQDPEHVQVGTLYGVKNPSPLLIPYMPGANPNELSETANSEIVTAMSQLTRNMNLRPHFGGGILGSMPYILSNTNLTSRNVPFADYVNHRRLSARIYLDLLCHENPPLEFQDVPDNVLTGPHTFNLNKACMQCHYSYDPLSYGYRNLFHSISVGRVPNPLFNISGYHVIGMARLPVVPSSTAHSLQPPQGQWRFRPHFTTPAQQPNVVNLTFQNLQQAGTQLGNLNDFYLCAAKKYFQFLTGIKIPLQNSSSTTPAATAMRGLQTKLRTEFGPTLRNENVRNLFKKILETPEFQTRNYRNTLKQDTP